MINFWGIWCRDSCLNNQKCSFWLKIRFFRKTYNCQWAVARCYVCTYTKHIRPCKWRAASFPQAEWSMAHAALWGSAGELRATAKSWFMSFGTSMCGCAHCTDVPRVAVGYQRDNLGSALALKVLWWVQLPDYDHFWLHLSFTASSGNCPKSTTPHWGRMFCRTSLCWSVCMGSLAGSREKCPSRCIDRLSCVSVLFVKNHELKSICRSGVSKDNTLLFLHHPSGCVY